MSAHSTNAHRSVLSSTRCAADEVRGANFRHSERSGFARGRVQGADSHTALHAHRLGAPLCVGRQQPLPVLRAEMSNADRAWRATELWCDRRCGDDHVRLYSAGATRPGGTRSGPLMSPSVDVQTVLFHVHVAPGGGRVRLPHHQQGALALAMPAVAMPMAEVQALTDLSQINRLLQVGALSPSLHPAFAPPTSALSTTGQPTRA